MFITFEGIEGCGKTTQARRLVENLNGVGIDAVLTLEPGGTTLGAEIRSILLDARNEHLPALAELLLYEADRCIHVTSVIKPALTAGKWVICDRFFDATTVYQGYARGLDLEMIRSLNLEAAHHLTPDMTILIDCPVEVGIGRAVKRNLSHEDQGQDRFERERIEFHRRVKDGYLRMAEKEAGRFVVMDGMSTER
ncbi:MAG: dTMP kinase [Deltaproteobacteria bacterium]|nr:dTMP kinase [Deltaproteobacteria bacterium]